MFDINKFLEDREKRVELQNSLITEYKLPLLTVRTNYPGENKREAVSLEIADIISKEIEIFFEDKIKVKRVIDSLEGRIYLFFIDKKPLEIKKETIYFEENHILGRCVDLDVYDVDGKGISRSDFNLPKRRCLICNELAFICGRTMKHSHSELKDMIVGKYIAYQRYLQTREKITDILADFALEGMVYEVSSYPSFGLVSPLTKGSHTDMDFFTFLKSSFEVKKGMKEMGELMFSYLPLDIAFNRIRKIGIETEKKMFEVTENVNTHKGMIFLMGIAVGATARAIYENGSFNEISKIIKEMTKDILKDFENINPNGKLTHGERLYLEHGFTGIRGEIKNGLELVFKGSLEIFEEVFEKEKDINKASLHTLIYLMGKVMDSTIVYRHNFEVLEQVRAEMDNIYKLGGVYNKENMDLFPDLEKKYISKRISPGGSADLLAVTIFLYKVKKYLSINIVEKTCDSGE